MSPPNESALGLAGQEGAKNSCTDIQAAQSVVPPPPPVNCPAQMKAARRWLLWKKLPGSPKPRKVPFYVDGTPRSGELDGAADLARLATFEEAVAALIRPGSLYAGLGFALGPDGTGNYWQGVDYDELSKRDVGWHLKAYGTPGYLEQSPSGDGVHAIGYGARFAPLASNGTGIEAYCEKRFFTVTGGALGGEICDLSTTVCDVLAPLHGPVPDTAPANTTADWTDGPEEGWKTPRTREEIIAEASNLAARERAPAIFGGRWSLQNLWRPDASLMHGDHLASEPRAALLCMLMHRAGGDCETVLALALEHGGCVKHDREELLRDEILSARVKFLEWWLPEKARRDAQLEEARKIGEEIGEEPLPVVLTLEGMLARLVYIESTREVVDRETGRVRSAEAAKGTYAASQHRYITAEGKTRDVPALPLWLCHPARISVDVVTWNPAAGEFCAAPESAPGNTRAVNTWRGFKPLPAPADWAQRVAPFLEHVAYLVPDEAQRPRLLQWLGHIAQRPGELPHTGYLMTARETGIGRNWLGGLLARVFPGHVAVGVPLGSILDGKFNGRLSQKVLATVDEAREGMSGNRYERGEALKKLITEEYREINPKYGCMRVEFNCCRWLMFSNHDDALPFDANDRRIIVIANPTERQSPEYYRGLYALLGDAQFIGSVRAFLSQVDLRTFNPGEPAPMSDAKRRALDAVASGVDRAVAEFKAAWPAAYPVAPLRMLRQFVEEETGAKASDAALRHAVNRAGVAVIPGRRVRIGQALQPERLVSLTAAGWAECSNVDLARIAENGQREFLS